MKTIEYIGVAFAALFLISFFGFGMYLLLGHILEIGIMKSFILFAAFLLLIVVGYFIFCGIGRIIELATMSPYDRFKEKLK